MRYLILLFLISCTVQECQIGPNATVQTKIETKIETKTDSKTIDSKSESKGIADQARDLRDNLQPGAQLKCNF